MVFSLAKPEEIGSMEKVTFAQGCSKSRSGQSEQISQGLDPASE